MRSIGGLIIACFILSFGVLSTAFGQDFYTKAAEKEWELAAKYKLSFEHDAKDRDVLKLRETKLLEEFTEDLQDLPQETEVRAREPSDIEKAIDVSIMALTGLLVMALNDSFDLGPGFRLSRISGLLFLVVPFEDFYLYRKCGKKEYLVASTLKPSEKSLERMKTKEEIRDICDTEETEGKEPLALSFLSYN
ncbi:MAG: hypothetical protein COV44_07310 [Deltaproteobacteria bacterium CG11_big_fil_rev_8_21_14_0_20_45_16]|nr:MAG: hypothetical protein COV44_07310 [Deltaproteobacteria bacterium CG11_big_fil_rev_8_21_14_0_20_45_16]